MIEVECDTIEQVVEAHTAGATRVLLDNMTPEQVREAVLLLEGVAEVEISGGITLETISAYADTGADFVSVGALTHSAPAIDISFEIEPI
jgi:nicotinate-nucleotide pyrophosphorylase (carboxylating)